MIKQGEYSGSAAKVQVHFSLLQLHSSPASYRAFLAQSAADPPKIPFTWVRDDLGGLLKETIGELPTAIHKAVTLEMNWDTSKILLTDVVF